MLPGDMIEWVYSDNTPVVQNEMLWSSIENRFVPVNEPALLIAITNNSLTWINSQGVYQACLSDHQYTSYSLNVHRNVLCSPVT